MFCCRHEHHSPWPCKSCKTRHACAALLELFSASCGHRRGIASARTPRCCCSLLGFGSCAPASRSTHCSKRPPLHERANMPKKKSGKKSGAKKAAAPAPAPAPAPQPEPADEAETPAATGDAAKTAQGLDKVTDGFATGQDVKADAASMKAAASKLGTQDPAKLEAEKAQRYVQLSRVLSPRCCAAAVCGLCGRRRASLLR